MGVNQPHDAVEIWAAERLVCDHRGESCPEPDSGVSFLNTKTH